VVYRASADALSTVKQALMRAFETLPSGALRRKLMFCLCAYAGVLVPLRKWDDFFPMMFEYARHERAELRSLALSVAAVLTRDLSGFMNDNITPMLELTQAGLSDDDAMVRAAGIEVFASLLAMDQLKDDVRKTLRTALPSVLEVIGGAIAGQQEKAARIGLEALSSVAELDPLFLKAHSSQVADAMLQIAAADSCELGFYSVIVVRSQ
jgi:hypothetical protein